MDGQASPQLVRRGNHYVLHVGNIIGDSVRVEPTYVITMDKQVILDGSAPSWCRRIKSSRELFRIQLVNHRKLAVGDDKGTSGSRQKRPA